MKRDGIFIVCVLFILLSTSVSASFPYHVFNEKVFNLFEISTFHLTNPFEKISGNYLILHEVEVVLDPVEVVEKSPLPIIVEKTIPKKKEVVTSPKPTSPILNKSIPTISAPTLKKEIIEQNIPTQHHVSFTMKGFEPSILTISPGDQVIWTNTRSKTQAMLLGSRQYVGIKSEILAPNETFSYTFTTKDNYIFVDAIMFSYVFRLVVE